MKDINGLNPDFETVEFQLMSLVREEDHNPIHPSLGHIATETLVHDVRTANLKWFDAIEAADEDVAYSQFYAAEVGLQELASRANHHAQHKHSNAS